MLSRLVLSLVLVVAAVFPPVVARADDATAAEAIFQSAKKLSEQGKWAEACPKFKASYELDKALGVLLNLANCWEQVGKLAKAWTRWNEAIEWAKRQNDSRLEWIQSRQAKVVPRLPKIVVAVTNPVESLSINHGATFVPPASYGVPLAVDPGPIAIVVIRHGKVIHREDVVAKESKTTKVPLDLAAIDKATPPDAAPPPPAPTAKAQPVPPPPREPYDPTHRNVGIVVGAIGIAAVLAAAGLEIAALVKKGQANEADACANKFCSQQGLDAAEDGALFAEVGQWVGIGGLAALAIGVTIFLTAPSEDEEALQDRALYIAPSPTGLVFGGRL